VPTSVSPAGTTAPGAATPTEAAPAAFTGAANVNKPTVAMFAGAVAILAAVL
jgi:hypothetical protein